MNTATDVFKMTMQGESNTVHARVYQEDGFRFSIWDCLGSQVPDAVPTPAARSSTTGCFCQQAAPSMAQVHAHHAPSFARSCAQREMARVVPATSARQQRPVQKHRDVLW
jgi:hypothetical protein